MPNLNETVRIRTEVDNSLADQGLNQLPIKVRTAGDKMSREMTTAGKKAGDAFGREVETRMNRSMRLVGQTFSRYFGEWGRMFGEIFQIGRDISEILPNRRRGGHGAGGSSAGIIGADIGSDVGQTVAQSSGHSTTQRSISRALYPQMYTGPSAEADIKKQLGRSGKISITSGAASGAAIGGIAGAMPGMVAGLGIGALVGVIGYFSLKMIEAKKETKEFAKSLGISTEKAKEFMAIGKATGNLESFTNSLTRLTELLEKARKGSKEARLELEKLGVKSPFASNEQSIQNVFDTIRGIKSQGGRDIATVEAGFSVSDMNAYEIKKAEEELTNAKKSLTDQYDKRTFEERQSALDNAQKEVDRLQEDPSTLRNRQGIAQEKIVAQKKLTEVDPAKTKEAEAVTKAIESQRDTAEELADLGKDDAEQSRNKLNSLAKQIELKSFELEFTQDIGEQETKKAELARLQLQYQQEKLNLIKAEIAEKNKLANIENDLIDSKLKAAGDGKLSLTDLSKTSGAAGRQANQIAEGENAYNDAMGRGDTKSAERIRKNIDQSKLDLVRRGIMSPDELTYEKFDQYGNKIQSGFNQADVLGELEGMKRGSPKGTELLNIQRQRGEHMGLLNSSPAKQLGVNATAAERQSYMDNLKKRHRASQKISNQTDFIRGVRGQQAVDDIKGNAVSLLDVINRNGGALPVKAIIQ